MREIGYLFGRIFGKRPWFLLVPVLVTFLLWISGAFYSDSPIKEPLPVPVDRKAVECGIGLDAKRAEAAQAFAKKDFSAAVDALSFCIDRLVAGSPEHSEYLKYSEAKTQADQAAEVQRARFDREKKKKEGVKIGMSMQDVLDSSWGSPKKVNRTTNASGTREQWVYGGQNYLYFVNGVLTSVQN